MMGNIQFVLCPKHFLANKVIQSVRFGAGKYPCPSEGKADKSQAASDLIQFKFIGSIHDLFLELKK